MEPVDLVSGSAVGALVFGITYLARLFLDYRKHRHDTLTGDHNTVTTDWATANAILRDTVTSMGSENTRLTGRIEALEKELSERDERIDELETRIRKLQEDLQTVVEELAGLRHKP